MSQWFSMNMLPPWIVSRLGSTLVKALDPSQGSFGYRVVEGFKPYSMAFPEVAKPDEHAEHVKTRPKCDCTLSSVLPFNP